MRSTAFSLMPFVPVIANGCAGLRAFAGNLDADGSGTIEMEEYINVQVRYFMENGLEPTPTMGALQEAYNKLEEGHARQMQQGTPRNDPPPAKAPSETPAAE